MPSLKDLKEAARQVWLYRKFAQWLGANPTNASELYSRWRYGSASYEFRHSSATVVANLLISQPGNNATASAPPVNENLIQGPWHPYAIPSALATFRHQHNPSIVLHVLTTPEALSQVAQNHWNAPLTPADAERMHAAALGGLAIAQHNAGVQRLSGLRYVHLGHDEQAPGSLNISGLNVSAGGLTFAIQDRPRVFGDRLVFASVLDALEKKTTGKSSERSRRLIRSMLQFQFRLCGETNTVLSTPQPDLAFGIRTNTGEITIADFSGLVAGREAMLATFSRDVSDPLRHYALTFLDKRLGLHELAQTLRTEIEQGYAYAYQALNSGSLPLTARFDGPIGPSH